MEVKMYALLFRNKYAAECVSERFGELMKKYRACIAGERCTPSGFCLAVLFRTWNERRSFFDECRGWVKPDFAATPCYVDDRYLNFEH